MIAPFRRDADASSGRSVSFLLSGTRNAPAAWRMLVGWLTRVNVFWGAGRSALRTDRTWLEPVIRFRRVMDKPVKSAYDVVYVANLELDLTRRFDTPLPIDAVLDQLQHVLAGNTAAVLVAPPGAGKTTRVPLALLDAPWIGNRKIIVLEPRRIAARASAERMAQTP